jgi:CubicO group peptidase (beta-lactamase class C family)
MRRGSVLMALATVLAGPALATTIYFSSPAEERSFFAEKFPFEKQHPYARASLVVLDGRVESKRYANGYSDANRFISWSMAKSVTAMLIGELVADGRLELDTPAPIAEWRGDARREITLRHLLHMASGLRHIEVGDPVENSDTNQTLFVTGTQDMAALAISRPLVARPGKVFNYDSLTSIILAEIITRTLTDSRDPRVRAQAYRTFAEERLFRPAGVMSAFLEFDSAGTQVGGSLIHMSLDDWGRMGRLLLDGKSKNGTQVIAPEWLAFLKTPSAAEPSYGGHVWLSPKQLVSMRGHLGQLVLVGTREGRTAIVVRLGHTPDSRYRDLIRTMENATDALLRLE